MSDQAPAKERANARLRRRHAELDARGLCTRCAKSPPEPGLKLCGTCRDKRRAADRARRARARAEGKPYGGRDPDLCRRADRARDRRRRRAWRDAGLCSNCGRNPPEDGRSVCEPCREARRAVDRRRYAARRAAGACVRCSEPASRRVVALRPARRAGSRARLPRTQESRRSQTLLPGAGRRGVARIVASTRPARRAVPPAPGGPIRERPRITVRRPGRPSTP